MHGLIFDDKHIEVSLEANSLQFDQLIDSLPFRNYSLIEYVETPLKGDYLPWVAVNGESLAVETKDSNSASLLGDLSAPEERLLHIV
jgi:hypothetical protein